MSGLIYVIEDEADIARLQQYHLSLAGYEVESFLSGETGFEAIAQKTPDLVVLDLMLPGMSGFDICAQLKASKDYSDIAIIMVTAKGEEKDIVKGLEMGADDYVTKPFSPKVLVSRVNSVLRRVQQVSGGGDQNIIRRGELTIHSGKHEVHYQGEAIKLTHSEFQILHSLAQKPGWVFTRGQLVDMLHGTNYAVTERSVDFQIVGLRKKLGPVSDLIETVRGVGYRFQEQS